MRKLREEAATLSSKLFTMLAKREQFLRNAISTRHSWKMWASIECEKRKRAEHDNQKMKKAIVELQIISSSLKKALEKVNAYDVLDFVLNLQPLPNRPLFQINYSDSVLVELADSLDWLRLDADTLFPTVDTNVTISFRSQHSNQGVNGVRMETRSVTPITSDVQGAADIIWFYIAKINENADQKFGNVMNTFRRYDENGRTVLVERTRWFLPTEGLLFEDQNWTVISPSMDDRLDMATSKNCYRLEIKSLDSTVLSPRAIQIQKMVFDAISEKMRLVNQKMQDTILNHVNFGEL
ncbi:hypothetical protein PHMEG_0002907 [Phytophthora megakarya]|uniref:M96 mating-specific protein n=1 Tax=Phytophthora megakarya TaxID=4795 RepID=A0A225WZC7_9STRA|nr:hypothetical protein PHMEG_0002907 [Phytophthora megakarya]